MTVRLGYFNLAKLKAELPEMKANAEFRAQAQNQIGKYVTEGNADLTKMRTDRRPESEIEARAKALQTEISAKQNALIELVLSRESDSNQKLVRTVGSVAKEKNIDIVVDASGIFLGGQQLVGNGVDVTAEIANKLGLSASVGGSTSKPVTVHMCHFNLATVKSKHPAFQQAEQRRIAAENELRIYVEQGNLRLQKMQTAGRSRSEIEDAALQLQRDVNAKQQELIGETQSKAEEANSTLANAVAAVARTQGLDMAVDSASVFAGGEKITQCPDITNQIAQYLATGSVPAGATNSIAAAGYANTIAASAPVGTSALPAGGAGSQAAIESLRGEIETLSDQIHQHPDAKDAYVGRALRYLALGEGNAGLTDATKALQLPYENTPQGEYQQQMAVVLACLCAEKNADSAAASSILALADSKCKRDQWPYPIIEYIKGSANESTVGRDSTEHQMEARMFIGFRKLIQGKVEEALANFRTVEQSSVPTPGITNYKRMAKNMAAMIGG